MGRSDGSGADRQSAASAPAPRAPGSALVSVLVPVGHKPEDSRKCLEAVRRYSRAPVELVVVHVGTAGSLPRWLTSTDVTLVEVNDGDPFAEVVARGAAAAHGELVAVLHDDVVVPRRWLEGLLAPFEDADVVATGPVLDDGTGGRHEGARTWQSGSEYQREAEHHRRLHVGATTDTGRLPEPCVVVRAQDLLRHGLRAVLDGSAGRLVVAQQVLVDHARRSMFDTAAIHTTDAANGFGAEPEPVEHGPGEGGGRRATIAACLIVRDEEENLPGCLRSVRGIVDEIVVCDTGSKDGTKALAERLGARVVEAEWRDDFAAARNAAVDACTADWILQIDADERLSCDDPSALRALLGGDAETVQVPIRSFHSDARQDAISVESFYERLFRRDRFRYRGRLHERLVPLQVAPPRVARSRLLSFRHDGYRPSVMEAREKHQRNLRIARAAYEERADDPWYLAYVLGRCLSAVGEHGEGAAYMREALDELPAHRLDVRIQVLCYLAHGAIETGDFDAAMRWAREASGLDPAGAQARYLQGVALNRAGRHAEARRLLAGLLRTNLSDAGHLVEHASKLFFGRIELAVACRALGDHAEAATQLLILAEDDPAEFGHWEELIDSLRASDPGLWAARLADVGRGAAREVLDVAHTLPPDDQQVLAEALAQASWPAAALVPLMGDAIVRDPEVRARWTPLLAGTHAVAGLARSAEKVDPQVALDLWNAAPDGTDARLGRARCLVGLGNVNEAVDAIDGIDVESLAPEDLLLVATLALLAGDRQGAAFVLSLIDAEAAPGLAGELARITALVVAP